MKKVRSIILLTMVLIFACAGALAVGISLDYDSSANVMAFDEFASDIVNLTGKYKTSYQPVSIDVDSLAAIDGTLMVDRVLYENTVGVSIVEGDNVYTATCGETTVCFNVDDSCYTVDGEVCVATESVHVNGQLLLPIEDISKLLGFDVQVSESRIQLSRPYATKRIIVSSKTDVYSCGAIASIEGYDNLHIFQYATEKATKHACEYFDTLQYINWYQIDSVVTVQGEEDNVEVLGLGDSFSYTSWGADAMGVGSYSEYLIDTVGESNLPEVIVAVLDTGIDTDHPWFENRIAGGGNNFSSSPSNTRYVYEDANGHGTHVSGIICDLTLPNVKILPVKVIDDDGFATVLNVVNGINYVCQLKAKGVNICAMNLSLGYFNTEIGSPAYNAYSEYLNKAYNTGILPVVAAGNDARDVTHQSPGNVEIALTISSIEQISTTYDHSQFTNYGQFIDLCAPGTNVVSARLGGGTVTMSGTSMAAPHATAAVALLMSDSTKGYSIDQIEDVLDANAIDLGDIGWDMYYGEGLINLRYAYADSISQVGFSSTVSEVTEPFNLTLSCNAPNATIYYTQDGSEPSLTNGNQYSGAIYIDKTQFVKAKAFVVTNGNVIKSSETSQMLYVYNGQDIEGAYLASSNGQLIRYMGIFKDIVVPRVVNGITITQIGEGCFYTCDAVSITLPDTVTSVQSLAFAYSPFLRYVYAPGVATLGAHAFRECPSLEYATDEYFPELISIADWAFFRCIGLKQVSLSNVTYIGDNVFNMEDGDPINLTSIDLPNVRTFGEYAFEECAYLTSINIPNVENVGPYAFWGCKSLTSVYLPRVQNIDTNPFDNSSVQKVVIGKNFDRYDDNAIAKSITIYGYLGSTAHDYAKAFGNTFVAIDELAFQQDLVTEITVVVGNVCVLSVEAVGLELGYQWYDIPADTVFGSAIDGKTDATLQIDTSRVGEYKYYVVVTSWDDLIMSRVCTVTVVDAAAPTYTIDASAGEHGRMSPNGSVIVREGGNANFTFLANTGYHVSSITVDGTPLTGAALQDAIANGYTFFNVNANHTISVMFEINTYTITIKQSANGSITATGGVSDNNGVITVQHGQNLYVTITPNQGYAIVKLIVDGMAVTSGNMSGYTFVNVDGNHTFTAEFGATDVTYTVKHWRESLTQNGATYYNGKYYTVYQTETLSGTTGTLTAATANEYYGFTSLAISQALISANGQTVVDVYYDRLTYTLELITTTGIAEIVTTPSGSSYRYGETVTVTAVAQEGYNFSYWTSSISDDTVYTDVTLTFTMPNGRVTVTAYATIKSFTITIIQGANGSIAPINAEANSNGEVIVNFGDNLTVSVTANKGYAISKLIVDGKEVLTENLTRYTFTNIASNHTFTARFEPVDVSYTVRHWQESLTQDNATYHNGKYYKLYQEQPLMGKTGSQTNAVANSYQGFTYVAFEQATILAYGQTVVNIYYTRNLYELKTVVTEGINKIEGGRSYKYGETVTVTAELKQGYNFAYWTSSNSEVETSNQLSLTFTMPSSELTLTAYAMLQTFKITVTHGENGNVSPSGEVTVNYGSNLELTITAKVGYEIDKLIVDDVEITSGGLSSYIFKNITGDHTFRAEFKVANTSYTVNHWTQALNELEPYELRQTVTLYGNVGDYTKATAMSYEGFSAEPFEQVMLTVNGKITVNIYYTRNSYKVTLLMSEGILSMTGGRTYKYGETVNVTAVAKEGYDFAYWTSTVEGIANLNNANLTFKMPGSDLNLVAYATVKTYKITVTQGANGSISPSGTITVNHGRNFSFAIKANEGYEIAKLIVDGVAITSGDLTSYTFTNITANHTLTAVFASIGTAYTVNHWQESLTEDGATYYDGKYYTLYYTETLHGKTDSYTDAVAYEYEGFTALKITQVRINANGQSTVDIYYTRNLYKLKLIKTDGISTVGGAGTYLYGEKVVVSAMPQTGYDFAGWTSSVEGITGLNGEISIITMPCSELTLTANSTLKTFTLTIVQSANGTIYTQNTVVNYRENAVITFTPDEGYHVESIIVDGISHNGAETYTLTNIKENHTVTAVFAKDASVEPSPGDPTDDPTSPGRDDTVSFFAKYWWTIPTVVAFGALIAVIVVCVIKKRK